ncbi:MAG TPA: hypothetical protein VHR45_23180 [Thermoanaerobaculia bacterium]|nr:hypothetical protein [Thermoanaerobaculia bacterium]
MKPHRAGLVLLATTYLMVSGCAGDKLTREKALSLLKEKSEKDLPTQMVSIRTDIHIPNAAGEMRDQSIAVRRFYQALRSEGLLSGQVFVTEGETLSDESTATGYFYFPVPGPDVEGPVLDVEGWKSSFANKLEFPYTSLSLVVARATFAEVTGLTGEGETVEAVVRIEYQPTERVRRITQQQKATLADPFTQMRLSLVPNSPGSHKWGWPAEETLHTSETRRYLFRKYDDGWRVEGPR